jgi:hypothetical protein
MGESVVPDSEGDREREEPAEHHDIDHEGVRYLFLLDETDLFHLAPQEFQDTHCQRYRGRLEAISLLELNIFSHIRDNHWHRICLSRSTV